MAAATQPGSPYSAKVLAHWDQYTKHVQAEDAIPVANGKSLSLAYVVAVARNGTAVKIDDDVLAKLDQSHQALQDSLASGQVIYGVNTGFGGSANTRTLKVDHLQRTLLREFNSGVLVSQDPKQRRHAAAKPADGLAALMTNTLMTQDLASVNCMPVPWVRAALLIRINSLGWGVSGVRSKIVQQMVRLLDRDIIPHIPMHGSISASGDLAPLSYIGSAIQGKATSMCTVGTLKGAPQVMSARDALAREGLQPEKIVAKEALAIMNGTAVSCGVGALVMHETHQLAIMAEIMTVMSVEALRGSDESFDPFFAHVRPHPGQIDSSHCIHSFIQGSKLINTNGEDDAGILKQDRYSVRTASQWLSPVLEDLSLAHDQISVECNSVTDNPLIEAHPRHGVRHLHGGNFQARAVTSAMEKARQSLQSIGRLLFTQTTEIINPATNNGLSPNLVVDEPSESFLFKSIDIMVASLLSELGFLANNAGSHVQTAEMANQALNSLALISGRYTLSAVDLVAKLTAAHLLVVCQAFDLRAMYLRFFDALEPRIAELASEWQLGLANGSAAENPEGLKMATSRLALQLLSNIQKMFDDTSEMDSIERFDFIGKALQPVLLSQDPFMLSIRSRSTSFRNSPTMPLRSPVPPSGMTLPMRSPPSSPTSMARAPMPFPTPKAAAAQVTAAHAYSHASPLATFESINNWTDRIAATLKDTWDETRAAYVRAPDATPYLGMASRAMYRYVREDLGVPLLRSELLVGDDEFDDDAMVDGVYVDDAAAPTVGHFMTRIYEAIRSGELSVPAMACLRDVVAARDAATAATSPVSPGKRSAPADWPDARAADDDNAAPADARAPGRMASYVNGHVNGLVSGLTASSNGNGHGGVTP